MRPRSSAAISQPASQQHPNDQTSPPDGPPSAAAPHRNIQNEVRHKDALVRTDQPPVCPTQPGRGPAMPRLATAARVPGTERTAVRGRQHPLPMGRPRTPALPATDTPLPYGHPGLRPANLDLGCVQAEFDSLGMGVGEAQVELTAVDDARQCTGASAKAQECSLAWREQPIRPALLHQPRDRRRAGREQRGQKIVRPT